MAHPSHIVRKPTQEKEVRKKRKYDTEYPDITLTEDDVEIVTKKVQDRGEDVV
jgi:hypothetical protein